MASITQWLELHDKLAGWAQFLGSMIALAVTYFTAFYPVWWRKRQLTMSAERLFSNGYEVIESYHRTSAKFPLSPLSVRLAASSISTVVEEIRRFPIFELDDQGSHSIARNLSALSAFLDGIRLFLESFAADLEGRDKTSEDEASLREFLGEQVKFLQAFLSGAELERPEWPGQHN